MFLHIRVGWRGYGRLRRGHVALTIEKPAGIDQQAGCVDVAQQNAVFLDFKSFLGVDSAFHFSRYADHA